MPRKSSIQMLPPEVREAYYRLAEDGRYGAREIATHMLSLGVELSKSAVDRDLQKRKVLADRINRTREISSALAKQIEDVPAEDHERIVQELCHANLLSALTVLAETDSPDMGAVLESSIAADKLASAKKKNVETFALRQKLRAQIAKELAKAAADEMSARGIDGATVDAIKARILGVGEEKHP